MSGDALREGLAQELMRFRWGPGTPSDRHDSRVRQQIALQEADKIRALLAETEPAVEEGCDCTELCSMGPTCPGGGLAGLAGSGCWRGTPPSVPSAGVEITEGMVERAWAAYRSFDSEAYMDYRDASPHDCMRAALVAALATGGDS